MALRIGIDLGGTKIEGIALDDSRELARIRVLTPRDDYDATVAAIGGLVDRLEQRVGATGTVGVGIPGAVSPATGLVKNANSTWLIGRPLQQDLAARLGREVRVANDANCFAVSEAADGAGAGARVVFGVILGTGVGAGVVVDGHLLTGANAIAGEWGHNPLPWPEVGDSPAPSCYCGKRGCIESYVSGPALAADYARHGGRPVSVQEIASRAAAGDRLAAEALQRHESRLARALSSVINVLDPDTIVLGGGLSNIGSLYSRVPAMWDRWLFAAGAPEPVRTQLLRAVHGDSSGVRGAAWLW